MMKLMDLIIVAFLILMSYLLIGITVRIASPSPSQEQINMLVDCSHDFCESKGFESRWEKKPEGNFYISYPSEFSCYDEEGKLQTYRPVDGVFSECGIEIKPSFIDKIFFIG